MLMWGEGVFNYCCHTAVACVICFVSSLFALHITPGTVCHLAQQNLSTLQSATGPKPVTYRTCEIPESRNLMAK